MPRLQRWIGTTAAAAAMVLPLGCGMPSMSLMGAESHGGHFHAQGDKAREIPLTPGVPNLGQEPVLPRDPAMAGKTHVNVIYTNDIHSRVDPFPTNHYYSLYRGKGGFGRLATAIRDQKQADPATIAVDSGDYLQGTPYFNFFKGETEMKLMEAVGFDAITVGNHEFDNGIPDLRKVMPHYKGTVITTNMTFDAPDIAQRYAVKKVGNVRVGMFALLTEVNGLVAAPNFRGAKYYDPVLVARATVAKLKKEADVIVLLSHMGTVPPYAEEGGDDHEPEEVQVTDEVLAKKVPGIDVIVSGHTHVMIKRPKVIRNGAHKTFIVSSGMGGGFLGKATLKLDKGKVVGLDNAMIPMTDAVPVTPAIESVIRPYRDVMNRTIKEEIGVSKGYFGRYRTNDAESALNNLIADATLWAARKVRKDVDFAVMSSGTPRNPISEGTITVEDVFYALPFDNKIVIMEVTGEQAHQMLEIQRRPTDHKRHAFSNASYTLTKNFGPIKDVTIGGKPLDPKGKYVVAVNDYMAEGSSGFTMLPGAPRKDTGLLQRDSLIEFIKSQRTITPDVGRIKYVGRPDKESWPIAQ